MNLWPRPRSCLVPVGGACFFTEVMEGEVGDGVEVSGGGYIF